MASRPCRRRRPSSLDDGGISGLFSSGGPSVRFLTRYDGEVSEPLGGRQGRRVSTLVARGSASLLPSPGRGRWPRDGYLLELTGWPPGDLRGLLMVALRSQGNWRWEGPLGTPLGLVHWKRASSPVEAGVHPLQLSSLPRHGSSSQAE